jgi:hypothetical protein
MKDAKVSIQGLPFVALDRRQWERLADFAALMAVVFMIMGIALEVYFRRGLDFRGYYAAARVVLAGGDPYDYRQVVPVLLKITGEMGNNPYYYPPWFALALTPLALLPYQLARGVWLLLNLAMMVAALAWTSSVLDWSVCGWRRWLAWLSAVYLFIWLSLRPEQVGTMLLFFLVLTLWAARRGRDLLAGTSLALLLTKPNVTWLVFVLLMLVFYRRQRRVAVWALIVLAALLIISTALLPGWYKHLHEPGFSAGLTLVLDGPDRITSSRLNTTLSHWLTYTFRMPGFAVWVVWGVLAVGCLLWVVYELRARVELGYLAAIGVTIGLLLGPYVMQYDYPPLTVVLFWVYRESSRLVSWQRWAVLAILAGAFSVPVWERPVYDEFWILVAMTVLLVGLRLLAMGHHRAEAVA